MRYKTVHTPADSRYTEREILDPIYISREQWECASYFPDHVRSRLIIVDFIEEEECNGETN